jgi:hypothetical protein
MVRVVTLRPSPRLALGLLLNAVLVSLLVSCDTGAFSAGSKNGQGKTEPAPEPTGLGQDGDDGTSGKRRTAAESDDGDADDDAPKALADDAHAYVHSPTTLFGYAMPDKTTRIGDFRVGGAPVADMGDIAIDAKGHIVGVAMDGSIYRIDARDASCERITRVPPGTALNALAYRADGRLVGASPNAGLFLVDEKTGALAPFGAAGGYVVSSGDLAALPSGSLFWSVRGSGVDEGVVLDGASSAMSPFGPIGPSVLGLAFYKGVLLGFTSDGTVLQIANQVGGGGRPVGHVDVPGGVWGAASIPPKS